MPVHFIQDTLALLHIAQVGGGIFSAMVPVGIVGDQLFHLCQLASQLRSIIHVPCPDIFFFNNGFCIGTAVVGDFYLKFRQIIHRRKIVYNIFLVFTVFTYNHRHKGSGNINFHIVLDAGLQPSFHIHIVIVIFLNIGHARRIGNCLA